ncbi:hypothetical protein AFK20_11870 [Enhydrobacter aerosaccus]|uniref:Uncharacterized protein n=1 Tax=Enhydrobacter aerosaccus TaxID=225324 RepID=A0ABR5IJ12_9HYPH|nr:hypothetical protein [Enhydrobacter aerosaccus]KND18077.1 hypothetical protein AFK20_11870 [Enhydrobacter aerosaccus]
MKLLQGLVLTTALITVGQTHSYAKQDPSTMQIVPSSDGTGQFLQEVPQSTATGKPASAVAAVSSSATSAKDIQESVENKKVAQPDDKAKVEESSSNKFREIIEILLGVLGVGLAAFCLYKLSRIRNEIANLQEQVDGLSKANNQPKEANNQQDHVIHNINLLLKENKKWKASIAELQGGFEQLQQQLLHSPKQQSAISASQAPNRPTTAKPELPVDTLMQEELRPKPTPKAKEEITEFFYFTKASKDNGFNLSEGTKHKENESLFGVAHYSNDEWKFDFISDQSTMSGIIRNIDQMLASVCDIENYVEKNPTSIENISPGKLERNGENLVVIKKAVVRLK